LDILRSDASIQSEIVRRIGQAPWLDAEDVSIAVERGKVVVTGRVEQVGNPSCAARSDRRVPRRARRGRSTQDRSGAGEAALAGYKKVEFEFTQEGKDYVVTAIE
jgi:BON domain